MNWKKIVLSLLVVLLVIPAYAHAKVEIEYWQYFYESKKLLVDELIKHNMDFDMLVMPNRNHGFAGEPYVIRRTWDYFVEHLLGEREGTFNLIMETLSEGRIGVSANMVGVAQAAYEASLKYANERIQFGRPIGQFQAVAHKLADMATNIRAGRLMVFSAARLLDQGKPCTLEASSCKLFVSEMAVNVAREAIQIHGGYGLMTEYPVSRYLRDALVYTIGEGTSEIQRNIIAKEIGL